MFQDILSWLDGKKSTILSILALVIVFLMQNGTISNNVGLLLQSILSVLTGGAIVATNKLGIGKK
jgi:hypothetical protein